MAPRAVLTSQEPVFVGGRQDLFNTLFHLCDRLFVEEAPRLFVKWAVDRDNVRLCEQFVERIHPPATDLLLLLRGQWLVVKVEKLFAVERLQPPQHALTDTADGHGTDHLAFQVEFVLGGGSDVPFSGLYLLVGGNKVADQREDRHDDVLCDRNHVGAGDLRHSDATVCSVGGVQIHVVRPDAGSHGESEIFGLAETFCGEVAGVEAVSVIFGLEGR